MSAMTRVSRSSSLSIRLNVIDEDVSNHPVENLNLPRANPRQSTQEIDSPVTHTLTIRNFDQSNLSDPLFLHIGAWPTLDMVDAVLNVEKETEPLSSVANVNNTSSPAEGKDGTPFTSSNPDGWGIITACQLTMVMDYWHPNKRSYTFVKSAPHIKNDTTSPSRISHQPVIAAQRSLFLREILEEHRTRAQTVEYMEQLEDNDNVVEIVAMLEVYRQSSWAGEMIKAFPRECWFFYVRNVVTVSLDLGHGDDCGQLDGV